MNKVPASVPEEVKWPLANPGEGQTLSTNPLRNKKYYMEDTLSIFLVENQLFKVHRHFLVKESAVFQWMFTCPPGSNGPDGSSDKRPIPLPGVRPSEFEALLDFFYTENFQRNEVIMQEWIDLLAISTRFDFQRLRECAIEAIDQDTRWNRGQHLNTIDPIEQILLAEKHDVPHWLPIAYARVCERGDPLEELEAQKIGYKKTALLARARELVRNPHHHPPTPPTLPPAPSRSYSPTSTVQSAEVEQWPPPDNGFYGNRARVNAVVSEVFFTPSKDG